jgi:hypothetical protein
MKILAKVPEEVIEAMTIMRGLEPIDVIFANADEDIEAERIARERFRKEMEDFDVQCLAAGVDQVVNGCRLRLDSPHWTDYEIDVPEKLMTRLEKIFALRDMSMTSHTLQTFSGECLALGAFHMMDEKSEDLNTMPQRLDEMYEAKYGHRTEPSI